MNAMQACQARYDNMTPDDSDCFLDTNEGCNWQDGAATHLMSGNDYSVNSWTGVTYGELCDFVGLQTQQCFMESEPNLLGLLVAAIQDGDIAAAKSALAEILYDVKKGDIKAIVYDAACELLVDIAEAAADQMRADNEADDYDC